jgi:hypothetical protein
VSVDERLARIKELVEQIWTGGSAEEEIIRLIDETPQEQAAEMIQRLTDEKIGEENYLTAMDDNVHGENNLRLHETLSVLRLKAVGEIAGTAAMETAPILPWHDVMGFFEDAATFAFTPTTGGKIRIRYYGGERLVNSTQFGEEIKNLPSDILFGGVEYEPDQLLIIHDYDRGRNVHVVAEQLIGASS